MNCFKQYRKNMPDLMNALEASRGAPALHDFITRYGPD